MKKKYSISFFVAALICVALLSVAYQLSYNHVKKQAQAERKQEESSVPTEGNASKADTYYLKDLNGFVAVYLSDRKTVYEYTNILVDNLPPDIAEEVKNWKAIKTEETLYGFLENYSS